MVYCYCVFSYVTNCSLSALVTFLISSYPLPPLLVANHIIFDSLLQFFCVPKDVSVWSETKCDILFRLFCNCIQCLWWETHPGKFRRCHNMFWKSHVLSCLSVLYFSTFFLFTPINTAKYMTLTENKTISCTWKLLTALAVIMHTSKQIIAVTHNTFSFVRFLMLVPPFRIIFRYHIAKCCLTFYTELFLPFISQFPGETVQYGTGYFQPLLFGKARCRHISTTDFHIIIYFHWPHHLNLMYASYLFCVIIVLPR